jgi:hypothetical protein
MKYLFLVFVLLFSSFSFASGTQSIGFFDGIFKFFYDLFYFFTDVVPSVITQFFVYLSTYVLYIKFVLLKASLEFAHSVALGFLDLADVTGVINSAISSLPSDLQQVAADIRFFDGLTLIVEAFITRFVYSAST